MKHLKTIKLTALALMLLASACHKENNNEIEIPYGVELITQPGDCECKQWKIFELTDTVIYLFPGFTGDTMPNRFPFYFSYFKDTLLYWSPISSVGLYGPVCNPPEALKNIEIPNTGIKVKTSADFYKSCNPIPGPGFTETLDVVLTSFIIQKP